ncbi:hypothetical protein TNIN_82081 [Trichonephila inaurata madagascariensis]|uniref:Uncharacterized protein n=1 Tax=Trichonephila inaurata madagascariensis TaxID=2747483 RepID=A0A8X6XDN3_9ARAC|nr:hypothetical protein TNIN_82081 [Trichonephila inaurata madagascariensis]
MKQMVQRRCWQFSDGHQQVQKIPKPGRLRTTTTDENVRKEDDMIIANRGVIDGVVESDMMSSQDHQ